MKPLRLLSCLILFTSLLISGWSTAYTEELSASEIMEASYKVYRGEDAFARLVFTFYSETGRSSKIIMTMAWKNYHNVNGVDSKIIMFNEFPPDTEDVGFMAWLYDPEADKQDDMWLYLPELRTVRKMGYMDDPLQKMDSDQDFARSQLNRHELMPRHPQMDHHSLSGMEIIEGEECYVIESRPKDISTSPYPKRVQWITRNNFLPVRVDYHDANGKVLKQQSILWQTIGNVWTWDKVTAINMQTGHRTDLEQTEMKINIGLGDDIFTKRMMKLGAKALRARINRLLD